MASAVEAVSVKLHVGKKGKVNAVISLTVFYFHTYFVVALIYVHRRLSHHGNVLIV